MIFTILIPILIFASLWPYFMVLDIINFKKPESMTEPHLPDRPARRTMGRKNSDVVKSIISILISYIILCAAFYGLPNYRSFLSDELLFVIVVAASGFAFWMVTPSNRALHAYLTTGQIAVIHLCCSLTAFIPISGLLYQNYISPWTSVLLLIIVVGAMLTFSKKQMRER